MDLLQTPFYVLGVTAQDNRQKIMALAEERTLFLDSNKCTQARSDLIHPRKRLSAEIAWLPGTGLKHASEVLRYLESSPEMLFGMHELTQFKNILDTAKMIPIAQANLLAVGLSRLPDYSSNYVARWIISEWIVEIAYVFENIDPEVVRTTINEERTVSGFPIVTDLSAIETEIKERRYHYGQIITSVLNNLSAKERAKAVARVVMAVINNKKNSRLTLIDDIVDWYEIGIQESLEKEEATIELLDEKIRATTDAKSPDSVLAPVVNQLVQVVINWDAFAQPIQIIKRNQGLFHDASYRVAGRVRRLTVDLFNKYDKLDFSRQLINILQEIFAEVDEIAERVAEDARYLDAIADQCTQVIIEQPKQEPKRTEKEDYLALDSGKTVDLNLLSGLEGIRQIKKRHDYEILQEAFVELAKIIQEAADSLPWVPYLKIGGVALNLAFNRWISIGQHRDNPKLYAAAYEQEEGRKLICKNKDSIHVCKDEVLRFLLDNKLEHIVAQRDALWRMKKASPKQVAILRKYGIEVTDDCTKGEASDFITTALRNAR